MEELLNAVCVTEHTLKYLTLSHIGNSDTDKYSPDLSANIYRVLEIAMFVMKTNIMTYPDKPEAIVALHMAKRYEKLKEMLKNTGSIKLS
jgi:hypothetical protein